MRLAKELEGIGSRPGVPFSLDDSQKRLELRALVEQLFGGRRAACVEGQALTPGSPTYDLSHVQLVEVNREANLEKWIVPTDQEARA